MRLPRFAQQLVARAKGYHRLSDARRATLGAVWPRLTAGLQAAPFDRLDDPFLTPPGDPAVLDLNSPTASADAPPLRVTPDRFGPPPPHGLPALREAVAETTGLAGDVLVTYGAAGAFRAALTAFVGRRPVVLLAPCSPLFALASAAGRARVRWVPTHAEGGRLRLDFDALSRAMRGAALVAVADPGNPIGLPLAADDTDRLRWAAERSDVLLYVDETYRRPDAPGDRLADLAPARTLVAGSLTASGFGSLRVGWLTGPTPLIEACGLAQTLTYGPVPGVCQQAAWRVLTDARPSDGLADTRRATVDRLRSLGFTVDEPADGPFLWADVRRRGRVFAEELLAAEGVRFGPGDLYGPGGATRVRLSVATDPGRLREGLNRLARFVGGPTRPEPAPRPAATRRPAFSRG